MANRLEGGFVEPIINATRPGTLAGLSMTILKFSAEDPYPFRLILLIGSIMFLCSSFFIFFYTIYPARKQLWMLTSITFLIGLCCAIVSSVILLVIL
ncbi:MAG: hypothetical protein KAV87_58715 [Desulfobacteraceae bacterium]|nr:hypothetical protein [Desulfobacteraceae bacterium]